ncbi:MAG: 4-(cytidine 5'-diphospho)-2-C-methyl-D-erythritol kinase [Spirochaetales bacterium]|nr:4-(cytidine 5'-diphospho)-2-C-methyl-D-erythritol kinase [Spirochaetales bacterium]
MIYTLEAQAKVNIGLRVLGRRADGFHPLKTYFHRVSIADTITMEILPSSTLYIYIEGNESYIGSGVDLMERAARLFSSETGLVFSLSIHIEKRIPFQAGMGGGSSDASSVLVALNDHFGRPLSKEKLMELSLLIGSDVPFFTSGLPAAYAEGRGEILTPVEPLSYPILIVQKEGEKISTKEAFSKLDERMCIDDRIGPWPLALEDWKENYINDFDALQSVRKDPKVLEYLEKATFNSTTGSGSAQLLVFKETNERKEWFSAFTGAISGLKGIFGVLCCNS